MNEERELIGKLVPADDGIYRAVCRLQGCGWTLQRPYKETAEEELRAHADLMHPVEIPVYR